MKRFAIATVALLLLGSCAGSTQPEKSSPSTALEQTQGERINKALGESAELTHGEESATLKLTVNNVTEEKQCTTFEGSTYTPKGVLYKLDVDAYLAEDAQEQDSHLAFVVADTDTWTLKNAAGENLTPEARTATNVCVEDSQALPPALTPGTDLHHVTFYLEAPAGATQVVWHPWSAKNTNWVWDINPQK